MLGLDFSKIQGNPLRKAWDSLHRLPGGKRAFSRVVGETAPYTGTIGALVEDVRDDYVRASIQQRRRLTNHLNSVHAVALMNLGEMTTGVGVMYAMPGDMRGIPTKLDMEYFKKARGKLTAESQVPPIPRGGSSEYVVEAEIRDESGDLCARFTALWHLSPKG